MRPHDVFAAGVTACLDIRMKPIQPYKYDGRYDHIRTQPATSDFPGVHGHRSSFHILAFPEASSPSRVRNSIHPMPASNWVILLLLLGFSENIDRCISLLFVGSGVLW